MYSITELERREIVEAIDDLLAAVDGEELETDVYAELNRLRNVKKILRAV